MRDSLIIEFFLKVYKRFKLYYESSILHNMAAGLSAKFEMWASGSSILGFFDRDWNIKSNWRESITLKVIMLPVKLFKRFSDRFSVKTNAVEKESALISSTKKILDNICNVGTRAIGLFILAFSATQGLLDIIVNRRLILTGIPGVFRTALFLLGTLLVLINRPLGALCEGSAVVHIVADFFKVRGVKNGTVNK